MPVFTNHLRQEANFIRTGLDFLKSFCCSIGRREPTSTADLRMAVYAMQIAFENCHIGKQEKILYPAILDFSAEDAAKEKTRFQLNQNLFEHEKGREFLLNLRHAIDAYELDPNETILLAERLDRFIDHVECHLDIEQPETLAAAEAKFNSAEQKILLRNAQLFEHERKLDHLKQARAIFSQLKHPKRNGAAS
jgi:hemerythrin-like domain-containing protein